MFEGYFDESGDLDVEPGVFCVSGYFLLPDAARQMDLEWREVLSTHQIPYFHMVECAPGNGVFKAKGREERDQIARKCIAIIKRHTIFGLSVVLRRDVFDEATQGKDFYSHCVESSVTALRVTMKALRVEGKIACFFESGHKNRGRVYTQLADKISELGASVTFDDKKGLPLLQAADLLAWQTTKYVKDSLSGARPPRKDFLSLMEHPHDFFHHIHRDGEASLGVEAWPKSRREGGSMVTFVDLQKEPVAHFREEEGTMPIIPISATIGWRMGGGQLAFVGFKDAADKDFCLAFDRPRLIEATIGVIGAGSLYSAGGWSPLMETQDVTIESRDGHSFLRIVTGSGASLVFEISSENLKRLKE